MCKTQLFNMCQLSLTHARSWTQKRNEKRQR